MLMWVENSQELTQFSPISHSRHLVEEKDSTKQVTIKDITSDSRVNSHFPYRWSPASLGEIQLVCGRQTLSVISASAPQTLSCSV